MLIFLITQCSCFCSGSCSLLCFCKSCMNYINVNFFCVTVMILNLDSNVRFTKVCHTTLGDNLLLFLVISWNDVFHLFYAVRDGISIGFDINATFQIRPHCKKNLNFGNAMYSDRCQNIGDLYKWGLLKSHYMSCRIRLIFRF